MKKNNDMICEVELEKSFSLAEEINVYNDGKKDTYVSGSEEYITILNGWDDLLKTAYNMPAFGVSLNDLTLDAMKSGLWVEFDYGKTYKSYEMYYDKLLINVMKDSMGVNLIRHNERGYDGRCFYFNLNSGNTSEFYDLLINL